MANHPNRNRKIQMPLSFKEAGLLINGLGLLKERTAAQTTYDKCITLIKRIERATLSSQKD